MARTVSRAGVRMVLKDLWIEDITFCPDFPNSSQTWCRKPHTDSTNQNLEPSSKASKVIEVLQEAGLYQDWPNCCKGILVTPTPKSGPTAVRGQLQGPWISTIHDSSFQSFPVCHGVLNGFRCPHQADLGLLQKKKRIQGSCLSQREKKPM